MVNICISDEAYIHINNIFQKAIKEARELKQTPFVQMCVVRDEINEVLIED